jgi:tetratricopeptide (TPR) repeat protein
MSVTAKAAIAGLFLCFGFIPSIASDPPATLSREDAVSRYKEGRLDEAVAAFDKLLAEKPGDDGLKIWRAKVILEQARRMKEEKAPAYKGRVVAAYAALKPLVTRNADNPDWYYAMAKAFWLNNRASKARKSIAKALYYRPDFPEAYILLGDLAFEEGLNAPPPTLTGPPVNPVEEFAAKASAEYERALTLKGLLPELATEARYKMGLVQEVLRKNKATAREWWVKAAEGAQQGPYGRMAKEKLDTVPVTK